MYSGKNSAKPVLRAYLCEDGQDLKEDQRKRVVILKCTLHNLMGRHSSKVLQHWDRVANLALAHTCMHGQGVSQEY